MLAIFPRSIDIGQEHRTGVWIKHWQVGKTTLISQFLKGEDYKFFDGDDPLVRQNTGLTSPESVAKSVSVN